MRNLFAWKIASLITIGVWFWVTFVAIEPAPDWKQGVLYVATPTTNADVESAFELELATLFAQRLKVSIKPVAMDYAQVANALTTQQVHIAATGMRINENQALRFSAPYQTLQEQIVCNKRAPKRWDDLAELNLVVVAESTQEEALRAVASAENELKWEAQRGRSVSSLLREVNDGEIDCTVANEEQISLARNLYPKLSDGFDLHSPSKLAWAFSQEVDPVLFDEAEKFIKEIKANGTLRHLIDRHYGHNERLEAIDSFTFISKSRTELQQFKPWFIEAAAATGIEWHLLAALAYQESHWDPLATSFTNVRGMMMLTESTAQRMQIADRLDAQSSILGGAKYLKLLKDSLPKRINDKERTWMALAAYNQGLGHLEDARVLAVKAGLNPDVWSDVRQVMPLLARPAYYEQTKYGQARGGEAVILVETVRLYHDIINQLEVEEMQKSLPPTPYFGYYARPRKKTSAP